MKGRLPAPLFLTLFAGLFAGCQALEQQRLEIINQLGQSYYAEGIYPKALHQFDKALELDPENPTARLGRGLSLMQQGDYPTALEILREERRRQGENYQIRLGIGLCYLKIGEKSPAALPAAVRNFTRALRFTAPDNLEVHRLLGIACSLRGPDHYPEAEKHFELCLAQLADLRREFSRNSGELPPGPDPDEEMNRKRKLEWLTGQEVPLLEVMAGVTSSRKERKRSSGYIQRILEIDPQNVIQHYELGRQYLLAGKKAEAIREFKIFLQLGPTTDPRLRQETRDLIDKLR